jgi:serine protease
VFAKGISSADLATRLARDTEVEFAEPDLRRRISALPNDPRYAGAQPSPYPTVGQWYLRTPTANFPGSIDATSAWQVSKGSSTVVVAVLDSGVRYDHPDLVGKLYPGYDFISDKLTANDGDGVDGDASDPGDWLTQADIDSGNFDPCTSADIGGSLWHGTEVAGIVGAATNNGVGMASVAPNVMVLPVRVLGKCGGFDSDIQAAMRWAAGLSTNPVPNPHPAKVLNLSLGAAGLCTVRYQQIFDELAQNGVVVVVSAGNSYGLATDSPANCTGAIAVAGIQRIGTKVGYSNIGPDIALSAPAGNCTSSSPSCDYSLITTNNTGATSPGSNSYSNGSRYSLGTSFSAPMVAATAAMMLSVDSSLTPAQVKSKLQDSSRPFPVNTAVPLCRAPNSTTQNECECTTTTCGAGMLDVGATLRLVAPSRSPYVPIGASTANPVVGESVTLDASDATVAGGSGTYLWKIVSGSGELIGAINGPVAILVPRANGYLTVSMLANDGVNNTRTSAQTTMLVGPPVGASANPPLDSGGGGALGASWLALLGVAVLALRASPRRT